LHIDIYLWYSSCDPTYQELEGWLRGLGFSPCQRLRPALFPGVGRGLQATEDIEANSVLVSIPLAALATRQSVLHLPSYSSPAAAHLSTQALLALWLCREASPTYLSSLPTSYTTPYFATPGVRASLPAHLQDQLSEQRDLVDKDYLAALQVDPGMSRARFDWAWFTVNTRAVYLDTDPRHPCAPTCPKDSLALAPYLDLLNHHPEARVVAGVNLDPLAPPGYQIITRKPVRKHEQVFIHYGAHTNTTLLLDYGFVLRGSHQDGIKLELEHLTSSLSSSSCSSSDLLAGLEVVVAEGLDSGFVICPKTGLTWSGRACLRLLSMTPTELATWRRVYEEDLDSLVEAESLVRQLEEETSACLASLEASHGAFSGCRTMCIELLEAHGDLLLSCLA